MLCNECGKNEANVHLTHIINGKRQKAICVKNVQKRTR